MIYLVSLEFRTPPFNLQFHHPNAQVSAPLILDGAFSFLGRFIDTDDWREDYLVSAFDQISHDSPRIKSSYMFPAEQNKDLIKIVTPLGTCLTFKIDEKAKFGEVSDKCIIRYVPFSLRLRRGFDLPIMLNLVDSLDLIELKKKKRGIKGISAIEERKGPHKSISIDVKVSTSHLFWCTFIDTENLDTLRKYLEYLKVTGIGKKRNMGWGDLKKFDIYELKSNENITISVDKIEYNIDNKEFIETIRPKELKDIQKLLEKKYTLIKSQFGQGSINPPYWGKETVVYWAKLQKKSAFN